MVASALRPAAVEAARAERLRSLRLRAHADQPAPGEPLAESGDRAGRAPGPAAEGHQQGDQHEPPEDPDDGDDDVAVADRRAERSGDQQEEEGHRHGPDQGELEPAPPDQAVEPGQAGQEIEPPRPMWGRARRPAGRRTTAKNPRATAPTPRRPGVEGAIRPDDHLPLHERVEGAAGDRAAVAVLAGAPGGEDDLLDLLERVAPGRVAELEAVTAGQDLRLEVVALQVEAVDHVGRHQPQPDGLSPVDDEPVGGVAVLAGDDGQLPVDLPGLAGLADSRRSRRSFRLRESRRRPRTRRPRRPGPALPAPAGGRRGRQPAAPFSRASAPRPAAGRSLRASTGRRRGVTCAWWLSPAHRPFRLGLVSRRAPGRVRAPGRTAAW